jgi:uncharacterized protein (DUF488 family)
MEKDKGFLTIGYGKKDINLFIQTLLKYRVNCVVDVRSSPYSNYSPNYKKEALKNILESNNISYEWKGDCLGGRPDDLSAYDENGIVDYEKLVKTKLFMSGIKYLENLCLEKNIAIMCSEEDALKCHRFLAISRELAKKKYRIVHITYERSHVIQAEMEDRLVKSCFGLATQLSLFGNMDQLIADSYSKQNKKYAYRRKK